ncbi:uncharacterized protein BXZ73DRAFT_99573 [Epithele typhae]|uniref:uncharacterized protein n=1 Tax=Epithele typhae TaxID=378194 RepID=UPI0020088B19|nr:uncharacterized protein BXZ73DRAFT_99573 [Epithele typhae]KAH9939370.1 hypothetical protein BXZ73DRAFT_99573 [Epithele typhae]
MSSLLDLNLDLLLLIISYLQGWDALNLSLCAKRAYHLAIPRAYVYLDKTCRDHADFNIWRERVFALDPILKSPRISCLRSLVIQHRGQHGLRAIVAGLVEVFAQARRLESFVARFEESLDPGVTECPRLGEALGALKFLRQLNLTGVGSATMHMLHALPNAPIIEALSLDYHPPNSWSAGENPFPALAKVLSRFARLRYLMFVFKQDLVVPELDPSIPPTNPLIYPQLPSLRTLAVAESYSCNLMDLVPLCPNLSSLSYISLRADANVYRRKIADTPWPALRAFECLPGYLQGRQHPPPSLPQSRGDVSRLTIVTPLSISAPSLSPMSSTASASTFAFVRAVQPSALVLKVLLRSPSSSSEKSQLICWADAFRVDPPLRSLELLFLSPNQHLTGLGAAMEGMSLYYLGVHVIVDRHKIFQRNVTRTEVARALDPRAFFDAIPTLRVLGIGDQMLALDHTGKEREAPREPDETSREWTRRTRWWWMEGGEMVEIWREDAERAREIIERPEFDRERGLEGFFSEKCLYSMLT